MSSLRANGEIPALITIAIDRLKRLLQAAIAHQTLSGALPKHLRPAQLQGYCDEPCERSDLRKVGQSAPSMRAQLRRTADEIERCRKAVDFLLVSQGALESPLPNSSETQQGDLTIAFIRLGSTV